MLQTKEVLLDLDFQVMVSVIFSLFWGARHLLFLEETKKHGNLSSNTSQDGYTALCFIRFLLCLPSRLQVQN